MKEALLTVLRDQTTPVVVFRKTVEQLAYILAAEAARDIPLEPHKVQTPFAEFIGKRQAKEVVLLPILRAGVALLHPFLEMFPGARVAFLGTQRDEATFEPSLYYENFPPIDENDHIFILDPMLATGGTAILAIRLLQKCGANPANVQVLGIICSTPGRKAVSGHFPTSRIRYHAEDPTLSPSKFILPGLGDFGDRYFYG